MDELDRLRRLRGDPPPDPDRKRRARAQLLALIDQAEVAPSGELGERRADVHDWRRVLWGRHAPAVGIAAAVGAVVVGAIAIGLPTADDRAGPVAEAAAPADQDPGAVIDASDDPLEATPARDVASCEDPEGWFIVTYPDAWHTPPQGRAGSCRLFGAEPVEVDEAVGGAPLAAIEFDVEELDVEELSVVGPDVVELEREAFEVDGRPAVRLLVESTGAGVLAEGALIHRYVIDLGDGRSLLASTVVAAGDEVDGRVEVLDSMVSNLELHGAR